jgi:hypothetical protein
MNLDDKLELLLGVAAIIVCLWVTSVVIDWLLPRGDE